MRGEFGSISRKGSDESFGYGMRSSLMVEAFMQSCWANLPPELLRDVLMRIDGSESTWPGVCRSWREIMKEIVKTQKILLLCSLVQGSARKCRRPTCTDYVISLNDDDLSMGSCTYIGKLSLRMLEQQELLNVAQQGWLILNEVSPRVPVGNYPVAHISYELNVLGSRGPRRMQCVMDAIPASSIEPGIFIL
ncbi:hypothetical protein EZV62_010514 [Acer yangbiense]|uniref:Tubby C-terminal domain-containing protein n=1 Tax=Acer yangbiense TaxID=1000413 RepID=A0A5C7I2U4_9ROSI|nr:hypothetical protein EZV62_010514 [Acer yangbiense]